MQHPFTLRSNGANCRGQACLEWLVAAFSVIACLSLIFEASHWLLAKQSLILHAQRAIEFGAMRGGQTVDIYRYLSRHRPAGAVELGAVCVQDDVRALMRDFKDVSLSHSHQRPLIRFNHIPAQQQVAVSRGLSKGQGKHSGLTIAQANVLHARITAYLPVTVPWIRAVIGPKLKLEVLARTVMQSHRQELTQTCIARH